MMMTGGSGLMVTCLTAMKEISVSNYTDTASSLCVCHQKLLQYTALDTGCTSLLQFLV